MDGLSTDANISVIGQYLSVCVFLFFVIKYRNGICIKNVSLEINFNVFDLVVYNCLRFWSVNVK